ncbi:succinate dehydrogenase assembly factor 2 [Sinisalibacter aestuarii]|uniref:FAD assembly factor SdhE n=1 Tax=Sinisalibacter aestuarii TaxID=2949426 RepID=A0ABQ5M092_9RHOB|nr:succinate dehydrogenase assembly factor 2 [Sinisalibacter aestuarii]GKY90220.1 succinate dehydrogenase assembly factor 2 [Sinisalibacter aestuarii]
MSETDETRLKRLAMRSSRRGIKEMDIILGRYAAARLAGMDGAALDSYEALLNENDHDLYQWVTGQVPAPAPFAALIAEIADFAGAAARG